MKIYTIYDVENGKIIISSTDKDFINELLCDYFMEDLMYNWYDSLDFFNNVNKDYELHLLANSVWDETLHWYDNFMEIIESELVIPKEEKITNIETNIFDKSTIYTNCNVEIWENSITGESSIGWYKTEETEELTDI